MKEPVVSLHGVTFGWHAGRTVLRIPTFEIAAGERVFLKGPSGSGKSTLLGLLGGVLVPDSGSVIVLDQEINRLSGAKRDRFRADHLGIIFQMFNLVPYLSLIDNVLLPCRFSEKRRAAAGTGRGLEDEARRLLSRLGLDTLEIGTRSVTALSVGQQQRVAAARALIGGPALVIADEPTSSLDMDARGQFLDLLIEECNRVRSTLLFVSHDQSLAGHFDRTADLTILNEIRNGGDADDAPGLKGVA